MPKLTKAVPKYRKHRASGQAVVTIAGRDHYLGPHGTKASRIEYDRVVTEWLANGRHPITTPEDTPTLMVGELLARYWKFAKVYYRKDKQPSGTLQHIKVVMRLLRQSYGRTAVVEFGPLAYKAIRQKMVEAGHSRGYVNRQCGHLVRVFKWGVGEQVVPPTVYHALQAVPGLKKGRTEAPDYSPVLPVPEAVYQATLPYMPAVVADMTRFQRYTGCRPAEVCIVRPIDVDTSADVWVYRPESHKTEHLGRERIIMIGPKAQKVLRPYLLRAAESYCFSPMDSERKRRAECHEARTTPLSSGNRPGTNRKRSPKRTAGEKYTTDSYRRAIVRAVELANEERAKQQESPLPTWGPNRLRHSAATEIRRKYGLEAAQVVLGHAKADVTQVYAERDVELARRVIREVG
jgi:integrase